MSGQPGQRGPRSLLIIGLMGVGKTTVGRVLARRLRTRLIDTDAEIERRARRSVAQIFEERGEEHFRALETDLLRYLERRRQPRIVSTGGGLPLRPENQALMRRIGAVIWLRATPETIEQRVRPRLERRPLLIPYEDDLRGRIEQLTRERAEAYRALADGIYDSEDYPHSDFIAEAIIARFGWTVPGGDDCAADENHP